MNYLGLYPFSKSINLDILADLFFFLVKQLELVCLKCIYTKRRSLFGVKCYKRTDGSVKSHHVF